MNVPSYGGILEKAEDTRLSCFFMDCELSPNLSCACMLTRMVGRTFSGFRLVAFRLMCFALLKSLSWLSALVERRHTSSYWGGA